RVVYIEHQRVEEWQHFDTAHIHAWCSQRNVTEVVDGHQAVAMPQVARNTALTFRYILASTGTPGWQLVLDLEATGEGGALVDGAYRYLALWSAAILIGDTNVLVQRRPHAMQ